MLAHRIVLLTLLVALLAGLPMRLAAAQVDGVYVDADATPVSSIEIVAPLPDHNVVSIGVDAATACYRITVNGLTAEVPEIGPRGPFATMVLFGSAGGDDQVTIDGVGLVVETNLFWGNNTLTVTNQGTAAAYLFGDNNSVSATSGGSVMYDTWGGTHDTFTGNCTRAYPDAPYQATALTGVFVTFPDILNIVSPVPQGNVLSITDDTATETVTVTENGTAVTIPLSAYIGFNYYGSWNGSDTVTGTSGQNLFLYGSSNQVTLTDTIGTVTLQGSDNTVTDSHGSGQAWVYGTSETISGMSVSNRGPAPVVPDVYTGGSGSPPTVATPASASPSPVSGTTTTLSVLGADAGGEANLTYTWTVTSAQGATFSVNGTNAAKVTTATFPMPGSYTFEVIIRNPENLVVTSSVTVVVQLASIAIAPEAATVAPGHTLQFTATGNDGSGQPLAVQPSFTWTVSGGGTISATGLFTAGADAGGPFTVTASAAGKQSTTTVTVSSSGSSGTGTPTGTATNSGSATASATAGSGTSAGGGGGGCGLGGGLGCLLLAALSYRRRRGH